MLPVLSPPPWSLARLGGLIVALVLLFVVAVVSFGMGGRAVTEGPWAGAGVDHPGILVVVVIVAAVIAAMVRLRPRVADAVRLPCIVGLGAFGLWAVVVVGLVEGRVFEGQAVLLLPFFVAHGIVVAFTMAMGVVAAGSLRPWPALALAMVTALVSFVLGATELMVARLLS